MIPGELALLLWPVVAIFLFRWLPLKPAIVWTIVGGYLLLPSAEQVGWDLPLLPPIDKVLIPTLAALLLAGYTLRKDAWRAHIAQRDPKGPKQVVASPNEDDEFGEGPVALTGWMPRPWFARLLLLGLIVGAIMTVLTNGDRLVFGVRVSPALRPYDALSALVELAIYLLPFFVGRKYLFDTNSHRLVLAILCIAACIYVLPALYEVRMSPQLNRTVYGFFPHSWVQHIRAGGWRPLVFLDHGLLLGIFIACSALATCILMRIYDGSKRFLCLIALLWLMFGLVLAKTVGALLIAVVLIPVALFFGVRLQLFVAASIAAVTLLFPMVRGAGWVPTDDIVAWFAQYDERRAGSLEYRFDNEDILLARANERPIFGWGGFARARVFDEDGNDLSTTDGAWVIAIGEGGWVGYVSQFGLLTIPIMIFFLRRRRYQIGLATSGLCVVLAANIIDLIPNSSITPMLWMVSGMLMGRLEVMAARKPKKVKAPARILQQAQSQEIDPIEQDRVRSQVERKPGRTTRFAQDKRRLTPGE